MFIAIRKSEVVISGLPLCYCSRNFHSMFSEIIAHLLRVVCIDGNVVKLAVSLRRIGEQFEILLIVNLDERDSYGAVVAFECERLLETQEVLVEVARFVEIADIQSNVRDAKNAGTLCLVCFRRKRSEKNQNQQPLNSRPTG